MRSGKLRPDKLVTHRFAMNDIMKAYDMFGNAAKAGALKVVLKNDGLIDELALVDEMKPDEFKPVSHKIPLSHIHDKPRVLRGVC